MNQERFQRALTAYLLWLWVPFALLFLLTVVNMIMGRDVLADLGGKFLGLPLVATNGSTQFGGFAGIGILSVGGLAVGAFAMRSDLESILPNLTRVTSPGACRSHPASGILTWRNEDERRTIH